MKQSLVFYFLFIFCVTLINAQTVSFPQRLEDNRILGRNSVQTNLTDFFGQTLCWIAGEPESGHNSLLLVGQPRGNSPNGLINATGIVRIFLLTVASNTSFDNSTQRNITSYNDTWTEIGNFTHGTPRPYDSFGFQMSCSTDGSIIAVSAPYREGASDGQQTDFGAVFIFQLTRPTPSSVSVTALQTIQFNAALNDEYDGLGVSQAMSADGTVLVVSTKCFSNPSQKRGVFIYTRAPNGTTFSLAQFSGRNTRFILSSHGNNPAITPDGSIIAYRTDFNSSDEITILERVSPTNWTYSTQINRFPAANDRTWFGRTMSFHTNPDNGNIQLYIAAPNSGGIIYVYERVSAGNWQELTFERTISQPEYPRSTLYGWSIDLRRTPLGEFLLVGAPINVNTEKGQAILYQYSNNSKLGIFNFQPIFQVLSSVIVFDPNAPLIPNQATSGDYFGSKVILSDTHYVIGAINERPGAVYVYRLPPIQFPIIPPVTPPGDIPEFPPAPDDGGDGTRGRTILLGVVIGVSIFALLLIIAGVVAGILIYKFMRKKKIKELQDRMLQMQQGGADGGAAPAN